VKRAQQQEPPSYVKCSVDKLRLWRAAIRAADTWRWTRIQQHPLCRAEVFERSKIAVAYMKISVWSPTQFLWITSCKAVGKMRVSLTFLLSYFPGAKRAFTKAMLKSQRNLWSVDNKG
jgi:hypothetical protein